VSERLALVTGATGGIGRALCEALVAAGRRVIATGRDEARLRELSDAHGACIVTLPCDLGERGAWARLLRQVETQVGALDELVSNAGIVRYAPIGSVREEDLRAQLELDFVVPYLIAQDVGSAMRKRGHGAIVHITSTLGERPAPDTSAYAAAKAALINATKALALELAPLVRVNALSPGIVDTEMVRVLRAPAADEAAALASQRAGLVALHPLGRLGTAQEIAAAVLFLLEAPWLTGSVLTVDGGLTLR
jgi:NAD(P)-dependent dehydrogenase (short-subunit alcohol dehydrogenase family)